MKKNSTVFSSFNSYEPNFICIILMMHMSSDHKLNFNCVCVHVLQVSRTYCSGTYRAGPMRQISLVGAVDEEVGDYFPEFLDMLEESPFLKVSKLPVVKIQNKVSTDLLNEHRR